ncbi:hypothetical protein JAAARDRAFT_462689 [Jaapia argillacea MUCL 33604]|uniref:Uncharacterized protein n=1 Tax=Jaapia argillacea MUCL 33604 TaxID=933084 RepID=A0A067QIS8_9AGAM|nr:hypothetical protein JAAARDRAFT_462689 [Jaapia argillacea MUCL 33604]
MDGSKPLASAQYISAGEDMRRLRMGGRSVDLKQHHFKLHLAKRLAGIQGRHMGNRRTFIPALDHPTKTYVRFNGSPRHDGKQPVPKKERAKGDSEATYRSQLQSNFFPSSRVSMYGIITLSIGTEGSTEDGKTHVPHTITTSKAAQENK